MNIKMKKIWKWIKKLLEWMILGLAYSESGGLSPEEFFKPLVEKEKEKKKK